MVPVDLLNYQLIRMIGSGGMGEVYLARNKNIEQYVAVKALHPKYANNAMVRARFKQEAVMLNSLNHPNIVKFLNFVENEYGVFLIMEYVEGYTLEDYITKKNGLIVEEKAYPMMAEILDAFSYAHQRGIIHRDIKPSNIFLDKDGHIKVMDFGIAQILSEANNQQGGSSMGTPAYMSPEQVYGQKLDQRSDIYSLGVLFHQMLTGRAPYDSTTMSDLEIKGRVVNEQLPRMKSYYPYVSDGLQAVVDKATSKDADQRYENCNEMLKAVKKVLAPEKKSRTPLYIGIAAAVVCLAVGFFVWDYFRTKVDYYKDYAEYYGVPKGIGSLSSREMSHRQTTYRIESSRRQVRRVTLVNSQGKPVRHIDTEYSNSRFVDVYYTYRDNGKLDNKRIYDQFGKLLYKVDYDENMKVAMFKYDDDHGTAKRLLLNTTKLTNVNENERSAITRYLLDYDENGLLQKMEYASGEDNNKVGDADNIYGQAFSYDEKGRIIEIRFLSRDGKLHGNKNGLAIKQYTYDEDDNWTEVRYLASNGKPSHDGNNCPLVKISYDEWGNRASEMYYTFDGKPAYRTDISACGLTYEYDENGNNVLRTYVNGSGHPIVNSTGFSQLRSEYNDDGYCTQMSFLDRTGKPANNINDGDVFSIIKYTVNDKGMELSRSFFDTKNRPINTSAGIHRIVFEYDSVGNMLKAQYQDKNQKPAHNSGYESTVKYTYDKFYNCTTTAFYDDNNHMTLNKEGIAKIVRTFDNMGNVVKYEYVNTDGRTLVNSSYGFAVEEVEYDKLGNMKAIRHKNSTDNACMTSEKYSSREYEYDPVTNFTTTIKDLDASQREISTEHYTYDKSGKKTSQWTTKNGRLDGTVYHYEYDSNNHNILSYSTDLSDVKKNYPGMGYAEVKRKFDDRGNVTEETYFDASGKAAVDEQKAHKRIKRYDERNNYVYEKNLGKDDKPLKGTDVNPEAKISYDEYGSIITIVCYDGYGNPAPCSYGYQRQERKFNDDHLLESVIYKDVDGNLVKFGQNDYAKVNYVYNEKRQTTQEKYFDKRNKLLYSFSYEYNGHSQLTELSVTDGNGRPDVSRYGVSKIVITYEDDEVTPRKRTYYRNSSVLLVQTWDKNKGDWK